MNEVSAVITTYKREPRFLERAICSVLAQTYPIKQLIVVDDSPSDYPLRASVAETVEKYADRGVVYVQHPTNMGACVARNTGASACQCDFIAFLDDDDEWMPEKIEKQLSKFSDGVALVYCGHKTVYDGSDRCVISNRKYRRGRIFDELILENIIGSTSFPLIRKSAFDALGGFDPLMHAVQDLDLWLRIAKEYMVDYVAEPLVIYHYHDGEQITKNHKKRIAGLSRIIEKNMDYLKENREALWRRQLLLIPHYTASGQKKKAIALWFKCLKKCPFKFYDNARYLYVILRGMEK